MKKQLVAVVVAAALAGCVTQQEALQEGLTKQSAPPLELRLKIVEAARNFLFDPYSVRDVEISSVVPIAAANFQILCVKYNAKNRLGAYTGRTATLVRIQQGQLIGTLDNPPTCSMLSLRYYPFLKRIVSRLSDRD